jgi:serine/threonine protein phosphatase PrpC
VIDALRPLESAESAGDLLNALSDAITAATSSLCAAGSDPEFADSGSTLTAMLWSGSRLALVHIGDSRAYLLRDGGLSAVVPAADIRETLAAPESVPADVVQRLIELANAAGGPDNIACVIACVIADVKKRRRRSRRRFLLLSADRGLRLPTVARDATASPGAAPAARPSGPLRRRPLHSPHGSRQAAAGVGPSPLIS